MKRNVLISLMVAWVLGISEAMYHYLKWRDGILVKMRGQ